MVEALGISLKEFIFYLLNFAVLAGGLWFFLYHPFIGVLEARKQRIQDALDTALDQSSGCIKVLLLPDGAGS